MSEIVNPIKITVLLTLLNGLRLSKKNDLDYCLLKILFLSFAIELINSLLIVSGQSISVSMNLGVILFFFYWFMLIKKFTVKPRLVDALTILFLLYGLINFICFDSKSFNYYTFVLGAIIYVGIFTFESFTHLKQENLSFFQSNDYKIVLAPVFLFLGMSLMFAYRSKTITSFVVVSDIKLYTLTINFVNLVYYFLINLYIFKESKLRNA